jgi:hypothetical protein
LCNGISEKNYAQLIFLNALRPRAATFDPKFFEPVGAANRSLARQTVIADGDLEMRSRLERWRGLRTRAAPKKDEEKGPEDSSAGFHIGLKNGSTSVTFRYF